MSELLTIKEAAAFLRLSESSVRQMGKDGVLTEHRVGPNRGRIRFAADEVKAHFETGRSSTTRAPAQAKVRLDRRPDGSPLRHF